MPPLPVNLDPQRIADRHQAVRKTMLQQPSVVGQANFQRMTDADVAALFDAYDQLWFEGWLAREVRRETGKPLGFEVSTRLNRSGGVTRRHTRRHGPIHRPIGYEIALAGRILQLSFNEPGQTLMVGGLICHDRLEAAQRIMEHEIVHLYELLAWGKSSCGQPRFRDLVSRFFGHTGTKHGLVTAREHARQAHGLHIGGEVSFTFQGQNMRGLINRINHRATVLVVSDKGRAYSDGKKYQKYYMPLEDLTAL